MLIKDAVDFNVAISGLMNKKLPVKVSYAVQKNQKSVQEIVEFYAQKRQELIDTYAEKDADGNFVPGKNENDEPIKGTINIPKDNMATFLKESNDLDKTDIEIDLMKISMEDLEKCDEERYDAITPEEMNALTQMIKEE